MTKPRSEFTQEEIDAYNYLRLGQKVRYPGNNKLARDYFNLAKQTDADTYNKYPQYYGVGTKTMVVRKLNGQYDTYYDPIPEVQGVVKISEPRKQSSHARIKKSLPVKRVQPTFIVVEPEKEILPVSNRGPGWRDVLSEVTTLVSKMATSLFCRRKTESQKNRAAVVREIERKFGV